MSPTPRLAAIVAAAAVATFVLGPAIPLIFLAAVLGAALIDLSTVRKPPRMRRRVGALLSRGVPEPLLVEVEAPTGTSVRLRQPADPDIEVRPETADGPALDAELLARRRGRHGLGPVAARLTGPLGLAAWTHELGEEVEFDVYPDLPAARRAAARSRFAAFREPGLRGGGALGLGTEFESVREYSPDDDIRQVNWRATARLGRPMSNDYRLEQDRDLICSIDAGRLMRAPIGDRTRLDMAIDAVAALAATADELGDRFGVQAFGGRRNLWLPPARLAGGPALRSLHDLEASSTESDYAAAFRELEGARRALVFVFCDLIEEVAARPLVEALPVLARRHAVTLVSPRDPEVEAAITEPPPSLDGALRASVALGVLDSRRRAASVAAAVGVEVVDAAPERLASACVEAYLRARRRARL